MRHLAMCGLAAVSLLAAAPCAASPAAMVRVDPPPGRAGYRPVLPIDRLQDETVALLRSGCDEAAIADALARRYRFLGYVPSIVVTCTGEDASVRVRESSHTIDLVTFDPANLSAIGVKPDPDFESQLHLYPVPTEAPRAVLRSLLVTRAGDLYNFERYRADSEALGKLGYAIAFIPGSPPEGSDYPRGAYLVQSLTPRAAGARRGGKTQYLGGTASYGPRQKGAGGLLYEKDELFGASDQLSLSPTYNASAGGSLTYTAPLVAARAEPHRLYDLQGSLFSSFQHNRQLGDVSTDERQTGVSTALGMRPLRLGPGHGVRFNIGVRSETVGLREVPAGEEEGSTVALQTGVTWDWRHTERHPSLAVHLAPDIDFVVRARGGERTFVRPGVDGTLHGRLPGGIETDVHLVAGTLDRHVPSFELWSLGGPRSVRGFREDSFLGRHLAALQAEVWFPFVRQGPIVVPEPPDARSAGLPRFEPPAGRLFKWALFADGGYLSGTTEGTTEAIGGAGVGVRFLVPHHPFVVKVDYGWGLGGRGGDAFPYVSLVYRY